MRNAPRRLLIALTTILVCYCLSFLTPKPNTPLSPCAPPPEKCKWHHENTKVAQDVILRLAVRSEGAS